MKNWRETGFTEEEARDIQAAVEMIEKPLKLDPGWLGEIYRLKPLNIDPEWWKEMTEKLVLIFAILLFVFAPGARAQTSVLRDTMPDGKTYTTTCIRAGGYAQCSTSVDEPHYKNGPTIKPTKKNCKQLRKSTSEHDLKLYWPETLKACEEKGY
jgi:hypothetical protein